MRSIAAAVAKDNIAKGRTAVLLATKHRDVVSDLRLSTYRQGSRKWRLPLIYRLALDYFFWVGANAALREQQCPLDELRLWSKL